VALCLCKTAAFILGISERIMVCHIIVPLTNRHYYESRFNVQDKVSPVPKHHIMEMYRDMKANLISHVLDLRSAFNHSTIHIILWFRFLKPDEVDFFNLPNLSSHTMALGPTQRLTEMSTRNLPWGGKGRPAYGADKLTAICEPIV
jgi:hypothetical protein